MPVGPKPRTGGGDDEHLPADREQQDRIDAAFRERYNIPPGVGVVLSAGGVRRRVRSTDSRRPRRPGPRPDHPPSA